MNKTFYVRDEDLEFWNEVYSYAMRNGYASIATYLLGLARIDIKNNPAQLVTPTVEEELKEIKYRLEKLEEWWLNAPFEEIQRDLDNITALRELNTDDLDQLIAIGKVMADEKRLALPAKPGRPRGSKTRKVTVEAGQ